MKITVEQARENAVTAMRTEQSALTTLTQMLSLYPNDGQLLFLYGSELAATAQYEAALNAFITALNNEPQLHIVRFQLCLLAATLDVIPLVNEHLPLLIALGEQHYLGCFASGLAAIFADNNEHATLLIKQGIALNNQNLALNDDMVQLLLRINQADGSEPSAASLNKSTPDSSSDNAANSTATPAPQTADQAEASTRSRSVLLDIYKNNH